VAQLFVHAENIWRNRLNSPALIWWHCPTARCYAQMAMTGATRTQHQVWRRTRVDNRRRLSNPTRPGPSDQPLLGLAIDATSEQGST
jgi:hypothetical protein